MLKNVLFATAAAALIAGTTLATPAAAGAMSCQEAAKAKYPDSFKDRLSYKRDCKKAMRASEGHEGPLAKLKSKLTG